VYRARPIPDTGDLAADLDGYLRQLAEVLATARAREVLGALIAEAASDPELAAAPRARVVEPRRAALAARLAKQPDALAVPVAPAVDILTRPICHRALFSEPRPDDDLVDAIVRTMPRAPARPGGVTDAATTPPAGAHRPRA